MDYNYVIQQENIDAEFPYFSNALGLNPDYKYPKTHLNRKANTSDVYRYDAILRDLETNEPGLFELLVDKYKVDMDMFGYYWKNNTSGPVNFSSC